MRNYPAYSWRDLMTLAGSRQRPAQPGPAVRAQLDAASSFRLWHPAGLVSLPGPAGEDTVSLPPGTVVLRARPLSLEEMTAPMGHER